MSQSNGPSNNVSYDPLPLTTEDNNLRYNGPPSPDPNAISFMHPSDGSMGSATPRFQGAALYADGTAPYTRESIASGSLASPHNSVYSGSVYALNEPPTAPLSGYRDDPQDSYFSEQQNAHPMEPLGQSGRYLGEKNATYAAPRTKSRRKIYILAAIAALILLILAVIIPVYFAIVKPRMSGDSSAEDNSDHASTRPGGAPSPTQTHGNPQTDIVTGSDGSKVTMEDGKTFTYKNAHGGYWYWDENDPFNNGARAQSWSPALNETFRYGIDPIRGVNIGGWLVLEPFISPAPFEQYLDNTVPAIDEWTLCEAMLADSANGGLTQLEEHYKTFITEQDFANIAGAGLNFVRIPIGFWAIETWEGEPFLAKVSWEYFLKAIKWARKYGIRINLDLHALPGSQNGWNHSGRLGTINFLNGPMGYANAQRGLEYIRILAEFVSQPQYRDVVAIFGIMNEPQAPVFGQDVLSAFYMEAYRIIRDITGVGEGNGPYISIHDGFMSREQWYNVLPNADRVTLDTHPYMCFGPQSSQPMSAFVDQPCGAWAASVNDSMGNFGLTNAGEFSNAVTDCGLFLNGVNLGTRFEGDFNDGATWPRQGSCDEWTDYEKYTSETKDAIRQFALASMDALQNFFFWTWKIGPSARSGKIETPAWSYELGLAEGWMPADPRDAIGACGNTNPFNPPLQPWQTGGAGAGDIPSAVTAALAWPPPAISQGGPINQLPSYTATGPVPTLPAPTFVDSDGETIDAGNGWHNPSDTGGAVVPVPTCHYLDSWIGPDAAPPSPLCGGAARREMDAEAPQITKAPIY